MQRLDRGVDVGQDGVEIYIFSVFPGIERFCQYAKQAAQGGVARQFCQEWLDFGEVVGQVLEFRRIEIEQAGFPEHRQGIRVIHELE